VQAADILARSPSPIGRLGSVEEGAGTVAGSGKALGMQVYREKPAPEHRAQFWTLLSKSKRSFSRRCISRR
jgi:hypothetical protein